MKQDIRDVLSLSSQLVYCVNADYSLRFCSDRKSEGEKCFTAIWGLPEPCQDCQLKDLLNGLPSFKKSGQAILGGKKFISAEYRPFDGGALCFSQDQSQMVAALQQVKIKQIEAIKATKEKEKKINAQLVMLRAKMRHLERKAEFLPKVLDGVASGLMVIQHDFSILEKNQPLKGLISPFWGQDQMNKQTCHELLYGLTEPCSDCPIGRRGLTAKKRTKKLETDLAQGYLTESFTQIERDVVVSVDNSTRTIELAINIQKQQGELEDINELLEQVIQRSTGLQAVNELDQLFEKALEEIDSLFFAGKGPGMAIVQKQQTRENIERISFRNFKQEEEAQFLKELREQGDQTTTKSEARRYPLLNHNAEENGFVVLFDRKLEEKRARILNIFLNTLGSYVETLKLLADLERRASIDGLTGTFNRAYFDNVFTAEKEKAGKYQIPFSVIVIDINGLKKVNDVYGHLAGDMYIKACGELILKHIRSEDVLSRFGGDEYVCLLPSTGKVGANFILDRLKKIQEGATYCVQDENGDTITLDIRMSVGCASSEEMENERVFNAADERMYEDKELYYQTHQKYRT